MTPEEQTALVELAGMSKECPTHYGHPGEACSDVPRHPRSCACLGTGKVYLLDASVRVPCKCSRYKRPRIGFEWTLGFGYSPCRKCGDGRRAGRGWTPSPDRRIWSPAIARVGHHVVERWEPLTGAYDVHVFRPEGEGRKLNRDAEAVLTALARR